MMAKQGSTLGEVRARCKLGLHRGSEQTQDQIYAGPLLGDVVLKVGIEPFVTKVCFYGEANQEHIDFEWTESKELLKAVKPQLNATLETSLFPLIYLLGDILLGYCKIAERCLSSRPTRKTKGLLEQRVYFLFGDV